MQTIEPDHQGPTTLNGTTPVEILAARASGKRGQTVAIRVTNLDTLGVTPILLFDVSGVKTEIDRVPNVPSGVTDASLASRERPIHTKGTTQSLYMKLAAAIATSNPTVEVEFLESTDSV